MRATTSGIVMPVVSRSVASSAWTSGEISRPCRPCRARRCRARYPRGQQRPFSRNSSGGLCAPRWRPSGDLDISAWQHIRRDVAAIHAMTPPRSPAILRCRSTIFPRAGAQLTRDNVADLRCGSHCDVLAVDAHRRSVVPYERPDIGSTETTARISSVTFTALLQDLPGHGAAYSFVDVWG